MWISIKINIIIQIIGTSNFWRGKQKFTEAFTVPITTKDDQSTCETVEAVY
jgi:hypothetical protein